MINTIQMQKQNGEWIGTYSGPVASQYTYLPQLRAEVDRICKAYRGANTAFVLEANILRAAQSTPETAMQYMNNERVLLTF